VNETHRNLEKTTSSVVSVVLINLWIKRSNYPLIGYQDQALKINNCPHKSSPGETFKKEKLYSETLNNEYIERIHQMSYSSLFDNGMLQIFSFLIN